MSRISNTVKCKYCDETGFYWQKTAKSWVLIKPGEGVHNCSMRDSDGKRKKPPKPYEFNDQGNRVYVDIGYTPLPHAPAELPIEQQHGTIESHEDWAALQRHLKKILE